MENKKVEVKYYYVEEGVVIIKSIGEYIFEDYDEDMAFFDYASFKEEIQELVNIFEERECIIKLIKISL